MIGVRHGRFLLVIAATLCLAASAWAEGIFPVNDPGAGSWVFDQPSAVASGSVLHVAFVGDAAAGADGSPNTRIYYAAVNAAANFANKATVRSQVIVTPPVAIDNALFNNARHPVIALHSATELVILFQAVPVGETSNKIFRALLTIGANAVQAQQVNEVQDPVSGRMAGNLLDPSFAQVTTDNYLRVAYTDNSSGFGNVFYARVGMDNAFLVGSTILLSSPPSSQGIRPLPRLTLNGTNSHIVWAANNSPGILAPTGIYYAMVQNVPHTFTDNLAIGATQVLSGGYRWGFPSVFLTSSSNVWIFAADEPQSPGLAASTGIAEVNPNGVIHDGNPVNVNNTRSDAHFYLNPPGGSVLSSDFDAYQPEAEMDSDHRVHVTGYGFRGGSPLFLGTPGRYYVMALGTTAATAGITSVFATMVGSPISVGTGELSFAQQLPGDYTRPAFLHFSGKAVHFWSGPDNVVTGARNLYVTAGFSPNNPSKQSGCSMIGGPRDGEADRIPGAAVLLLPAVLLALRRALRKAFVG